MPQDLSKWAAMPLRVMLGIGFVYHGFPKVFSSAEHEGFVGMLQNIGVPAAGLMAWVVGLLELFGGLALIAGAFVLIVSVLLILNMLVALFTVALPSGFNFINITGMTDTGPQFGMPGYEVNLLYIAGLAALLLLGRSQMSVDAQMAARKTGGAPVM